MKKITLLVFTIFVSSLSVKLYAQKVELNQTTKIYEYSHVKDFTGDIKSRLDLFSDKMKEMNYSDISKSENDIKGESFFSKLITGTAMEIHYQAFMQFKEGRYKLTQIIKLQFNLMTICNAKTIHQEISFWGYLLIFLVVQ